MDRFRDQVDKINVEVVSPDGSVKGLYNGRTGFTIRIDDHRLDKHTEDSLSQQIEATVRSAIDGSQAAHSRVHEKRHGKRRPADELPQSVRDRRAAIAESMAEIHTVKKSANGWVKVGFSEDSGMRVKIRKGTLQNGPIRNPNASAITIANSVNEALTSAISDYTKKYFATKIAL